MREYGKHSYHYFDTGLHIYLMNGYQRYTLSQKYRHTILAILQILTDFEAIFFFCKKNFKIANSKKLRFSKPSILKKIS